MYKTFNETAELDLKTLFKNPVQRLPLVTPFSKPATVEYLTPFDRICFTSICVGYKNKIKVVKSLKTPVLLHIYADSAWKWQFVRVLSYRKSSTATVPFQVFPAAGDRTVEHMLYASLPHQTDAGCPLETPDSPCRHQTWPTHLSQEKKKH